MNQLTPAIPHIPAPVRIDRMIRLTVLVNRSHRLGSMNQHPPWIQQERRRFLPWPNFPIPMDDVRESRVATLDKHYAPLFKVHFTLS